MKLLHGTKKSGGDTGSHISGDWFDFIGRSEENGEYSLVVCV